MAIFKCKMCGGDLEIAEGLTIAECEYCGTKQTVPKAIDENLQNLFNRANTLRLKSEFDKAEKIYEKIIQADSAQSEAYWGLILCKYGIEYVDDPKTLKKIPTCHRASYDPIIADDDYKLAIENADFAQRAIYEEQAREIDRIQKEILALAQKEETYDVFICYKETDANGRRTQDSVIANDIYYQLTQEGFKVFYAAITLEGKLGSAYEPIIFAALNSAKVMLSIGTKPEYFNAVWVKNEWSRFLKIIKKDRSKLLIPCYRDMDAYELPEEFAHLQAQDMAKIGFINDLIRGIKKVAEKDDPREKMVAKESAMSSEGLTTNTAPLIERAFMFLEDGDWSSANEYCERVLDIDPKNAQAYLGKLMAELRVHSEENLEKQNNSFESSNNYKKAMRFGDETLKTFLEGCTTRIIERNEIARQESIYMQGLAAMETAKSESDFIEAGVVFRSIIKYKNAKGLFDACQAKAEEKRFEAARDRKDQMLFLAQKKKEDGFYADALQLLFKIPGWKNADALINECEREIQQIQERTKQELLKIERKKKRYKRIKCFVIFLVLAIILFLVLLNKVILPNVKYNTAIDLMEEGRYTEAISAFEAMGSYKDSINKIEECNIGIYGEKVWKKIKNINVGDTFKLGKYEQDDNKTNGQEDIEWLVLSKEGAKILVISKYALDCKHYNTSYTNVTWETSTLRKWLNNDFINAAFSADEKVMISNVTVSAYKNSNYSTNPGNATQDKVFLLSITEVNKYFSTDGARQCSPTKYAVSNGVKINDFNTNCWWWLRSPGRDSRYAARVDNVGAVSEYGSGVSSYSGAVRPALWIDLSA